MRRIELFNIIHFGLVARKEFDMIMMLAPVVAVSKAKKGCL
jgi:hypothetical protein